MSSVGSNYILKDTDVSYVMKCLTSMAHKWELLGIALGLSTFAIKECRGHQIILSLHGILIKWVEGHGVQPASLGRLVKVLASELIGEGRLASKLISDFKILLEATQPSLPEYSYSNELAAQSDPAKFISGIPAFTETSSKQDSSRKSMPPCFKFMEYNVTLINLTRFYIS